MTGPILDSPDLSLAERIDQLCTAFEAVWKNGDSPRLEDWLKDIPPTERPPLLKELLLVEVHYRRKRGDTVDSAEYRRRFPELDESCLTELISAAAPGPAGQSTAAASSGTASTDLAAPMPTAVHYSGGYELGEEIGRGGMGVVYRGRHADLERTLAVKVLLHRHAGSVELRRRFLEEAQIMSQLQHPGVAPIHEVGQLADGRPFFSMKQVQGQTLADMLKERGALVVHRASDDPRSTIHDSRFLSIFGQVCQTVAYAHAQGILHRDLKPANIMVGAFGEVQVMDWGLAKRIAEGRGQRVDVPNGSTATPADHLHSAISNLQSQGTAAGRVLGTAAYMAPEQARGEVDSLDERCDVFGLGAILCEILTGKPAFPGDSQVDSHRRAVKGDLSDAFTRLDRCGAEAELVALARQCLAADREQRPRDAGVVAGAVAGYQARVRERLQRAEVAQAAAQVKAKEERKRRQVTLALAAVLVASVLIAAGAGVWYYQDLALRAETEADLNTKLAREQTDKAKVEAERKAEKAIEAAKQAERREQLEKALTKEFASIMQQRSALHERLADALSATELLSDIEQWRTLVKQARESWKRADFLAGEGAGLLAGSWLVQLDQFDQQIKGDEQDWAWARELDQIQEEAGTSLEGRFSPWKVKHQNYTAVFQKMKVDVAKGDLAELADGIKATPLRYALVGALDDWASGLSRGDPLQARLLELSRRADPDDWRDQVRDPKNWDDAQKLKNLASAVDMAKQTPQVLSLLAFKLAKHDHTGEAAAAQFLRKALQSYPKDFWLHFDLGNRATDPVEQVGCFTAAVAVRPTSANAHYNLGQALHDKGDLEGALQRYQKALSLDPNHAKTHTNLGIALKAKGNLDGAIKHYLKAIELDPKLAPAHCNMGNALYAKKDLDSAITHFLNAIAVDSKYVAAHCNLGIALYDKKDLAGAIRHYRAALAIDPKDAKSHYNLGNALSDKKDLDGAIKHYKQAIASDPKYVAAHCNLGSTLKATGDLDGAIKHFRNAIAADPKVAAAHFNLGVALQAKEDLDGAILHYEAALALDPKLAVAHNNLGNVLRAKGEPEGAIQHYEKALALDPEFAVAHNNLATVLTDKKDLASAIQHCTKALALQPNYREAHVNLSVALRNQGKLAAALAALKKGHVLGSQKTSWNQQSAMWIKKLERLLELEQKLPAILQRTDRPQDVAEQIELAELCYYTQLYVSAARFFDALLAKTPKLAGQQYHSAACAAVLAAAGKGKDADNLMKNEPLQLRQQALTWLNVSLAAWKQQLATEPGKAGLVRYELQIWQCDPDLASVREDKELAKLPEAERQQWQRLWSGVAEIVNAGKK